MLDLGRVRQLSDSPSPLSVKALAAASGADPLLLDSLLRYLGSIRRVKGISQDHFTVNYASYAFSDSRVDDAMKYT